MKIGCVYTIEDCVSVEKPLMNSLEIPFGISIIATLLKTQGHDVELFVLSPVTPVEAILRAYVEEHRPRMFCLTAVSSQAAVVYEVAALLKRIDPGIFVILGGHHASLAPEDAIACPYLDAICLGEGDNAVIELATRISEGAPITAIPNLWIKDKQAGTVEKNGSLPFNQDLDSIPYIDRKMWERWILHPEDDASILVGRGCPFKCTYCSNHAMMRLAEGKYVRYRSPDSLIGEIDHVCTQYPGLRNFYLEVETIGASIIKALDLFRALAAYNARRTERLQFRMNLAVHSNFMKDRAKLAEFMAHCRDANVVGLNIGLESGSERIRKDVLRRPKYSNDELVDLTRIAKEFGIETTIFALMGLPGETPADFHETVEVVRKIRPNMVYLSIFYPYIGTDLFAVAKAQGLIPQEGLDSRMERSRASLDLPAFSRRRVRIEYVLFWYRAFKGQWSLAKIVAHMLKAFVAGHPRLQSLYRYLTSHSAVLSVLKRRLQSA